MPKKLAADLADRLDAEIRRHAVGVSIGSLALIFASDASPRSLARLLQSLVRAGRIQAKGAGPATRYHPAGASLLTTNPETPGDAYLRVSSESATLRDRVRRPLAQRRPVGYERGFLERYRPNETPYLKDASLREHLHQLGRAPFAQRPAGTYARDILNRLLIDLSWASSRLEGNTYTRLDTVNLIERSRVAEGKDRLETQMILNHKQAIEFLVEEAASVAIDLFTFRNLHALLSDNLLSDPAASGQLRNKIVDIGGTVYRPLGVPQQIEELFQIVLEKARAITDPFEQAFFLMVHVPYLQPFEDVNKRVARLGANIPLIKNSLCPLSFVDVPERAYVDATLAVYEHCGFELLRDVFVWAYERSCAQFRAVASAVPEPDPFRLQYRAELGEALAEIVRSRAPVDARAVRQVTAGLIPDADRPRFLKMVLTELRQLHEGNIARYRLKLTEFRDWKARQS